MTSDPRQATPAMRVVLWGTGDTGKPRVRILRDGLRANGVELLECHADVWSAIQDKSQVRGAGRWIGLLVRMLCAYPALVWRYLRLPRHDWVLLGYPAMPDIFVIRLFAWLRGTPVALDWFLSAYDTVVLDRALIGPRHPAAWLLRAGEWLGIRLADRVFMDTRTHARRMESLYGLREGTCGSVWVGAEDRFFAPDTRVSREADAPLHVLFYGQFIPLHGVETIIAAAALLRDQPVKWWLIGRGQQAAAVRRLLEDDPLDKLHWLDWIDYAALPDRIQEADVCLGIFGTSAKAASVIPNKVFQGLAAGRPILTRDSAAMRELLAPADWPDALVPAGDPVALARAVSRLLARRGTGPAQPPVPVAEFTAAAIGRQLLGLLATPGQA